MQVSKIEEWEARVAPVLSGRKVLVVDDNQFNQELARALLEEVGVLVKTAWSGYEAVRAVSASHFDAVLMDVDMPGMDGLEATRILRADDRFKDLLIVAWTAHGMQEDREKCLQAGMNDHVPKVEGIERVISTLAQLMGIRRGVCEERGLKLHT